MSNLALGDALLTAHSITKGYGAQPVIEDVSLTLHEGERIGLIGRNGSGKSTLLRILAGEETPDEGHVTQRRGLRIGLLDQDCPHDRGKTVGQILEETTQEIRALLNEYAAATRRLSEAAPGAGEHVQLHTRYEELHHTLELSGAWNLNVDIKQVSEALDLPPADRVIGTLSGGELRRVGLATVLLKHPDVLLLDEPTNHIDTKSVEWIEAFLSGYRGSCILVTHDRYFLKRTVTRIAEVEHRRLLSFPGSYQRYLDVKAQRHDAAAKAEQARQATLRRELAWLRRGPKARTSKDGGRIKRFERLRDQGPPPAHGEFAFAIPAPPRLGKRILEAEDIACGFGDTLLFKDFSLILQKGMRVGIVGPNGSGKSTLLRALMGEEELRQGSIFIGDATQFLYVDQTHEAVDPEQTILDFVSNGALYWDVNDQRLYVPSYLERFLFDRESIRMPMRNLSGGERNRIELAKKLLQGGNVLVLDEPTNDLDLHTLRVLEEAVESFDGCAFLVSHDRYFLNRLCTHLIVFEGYGKVLLLAGNYDDYVLYKEKTKPKLDTDARPANKTTKKPRPRDPRRLTYKEQQELAGMETAITLADDSLRAVEKAIHAPGFYNQEHTAVQETLSRLKTAKEEVERLYARWQELEDRSDKT